ncbi:preprotein translocase subunit YajC [Turicibacter sp. H121]|uniref:preprotein translocase subunit YajC n=1 Tax=Turicibacter sp. H121 TaxID=1712675 RepID=UPI000762EB6D|nr:preprotein translocase subunit YajC [Turicibacter sp. H121]AMC07883.1 preprotein translocase subunit YajC [Turicibacter sp. H121]MCU7198545.1 preprotein translocase subunit YajC [Turicibacter sp. H121]
MNQTVLLVLQLVLLGVIFYFFMIRPENKRRKAIATMQSSLEKGDRVVTIGGIHGRIHALEQEIVTLINDEGQKWIFERNAISRKVEK